MATQLAAQMLASGQTLVVYQGDLTEQVVDGIVNAANTRLAHGGGVAGAILRKGGRVIQQESNRIAPIPTGEAGVTSAGRLRARFVIHAVGPVWGTDEADLKLHSAVFNALLRAHELGLNSVALPAISTGIFGFPKAHGVRIIVQATLDFCAQHPVSAVREIRFVNLDAATAALFQAEFEARWEDS